MPLRGGESVGQAYVRIYGDGSSMPGDIRRALDEAEPSVRESGKNHGKTYADAFESETTKQFETNFGDNKVMFRRLNDNLTEELGRLELASDFFDHSLAWKKFRKRLIDEFGDAGEVAAHELERGFRDSADLEDLPRSMENIGVRIRRIQRDMIAAMQDDAIRENKAFDARIREQQRERDLAFRNSVRDNKAAIIQFRNNMREIAAEIEKLNKGESRFRHGQLEDMVKQLKALAPSLDANGHQIDLFNDRLSVMHRHLDNINPRIAAFDRGIIRIGDHMGRLFGRGSRNDFLNFFGSFVRFLTQAPRLITGVITPFVRIGRSMSEAFSDAGGGISGTFAALIKGFTGVAGAAAQAGGAVVAFAIFIGVLGVVLGPIVSILSGLVGILVALGSSLLYAAASGAAFFPLLIPVAAIIGGIVAAVMDLQGATGALGRQLDDISDKATRLWDTFKTGVGDSKGLGAVLNETNRILSKMGPAVDAAIKGFNRFAGEIAKEMEGGAIDRFIRRFSDFLPHAMKDLGTIFGNVLGGAAGLLTGLIPSANRLLGWLVKITDRFDKWANSKKGQEDIKNFMDKAADSAESIKDFLQGALHWLTKLIDKSKEEGDTLWERIGGQFQEWADYIDQHPDAFEQWMKDADELATSIGDAVEGLNELIDTLDSPRNRKIGNTFVSEIGTAFETLATLINWVNTAFSAIWYVLGGAWVGDLFRGIGDAFNSGANSDWWNAMVEWGDGVKQRLGQLGSDIMYVVSGQWVGALVSGLQTALSAVGGQISNMFSGLFSGGGGGLMMIRPNVDLSAVLDGLGRLGGIVSRAVTGAVSRFNGMASRAASAAGDIAGRVFGRFTSLPGQVQGLVNQVVSRFGNVGERISRTLGDVWGQISSKFTGIPGQVGAVITLIVGQFKGLAGRILATIGDIVIRPRVVMPFIPSSGGAAKHPPAEDTPPPSDDGTLNGSRVANDTALRLLSRGSGLVSPTNGVGKVVDASGWTVVTPSENPRIVATEVVNELIARVV